MAKKKKKMGRNVYEQQRHTLIHHTYWASLHAIWLSVGIYLHQTYLPIIFYFAFAFIADLKMM